MPSEETPETVLEVTESAQKLAEELDLDLAAYHAEGTLTPTGSNGRVLKSDVEALIDKLAEQPGEIPEPTDDAAGAGEEDAGAGLGDEPSGDEVAGTGDEDSGTAIATVGEIALGVDLIGAIKWTDGEHLYLLDEGPRGLFTLRIWKFGAKVPPGGYVNPPTSVKVPVPSPEPPIDESVEALIEFEEDPDRDPSQDPTLPRFVEQSGEWANDEL